MDTQKRGAGTPPASNWRGPGTPSCQPMNRVVKIKSKIEVQKRQHGAPPRQRAGVKRLGCSLGAELSSSQSTVHLNNYPKQTNDRTEKENEKKKD